MAEYVTYFIVQPVVREYRTIVKAEEDKSRGNGGRERNKQGILEALSW